MALIARYGLTSPPGRRFSTLSDGPWPTTRMEQVRLSFPQATAVGAKEPTANRLYELMLDRKSTRLNSSHANISYAVFCLKKKPRHAALDRPLLQPLSHIV